MSLDYGRWNYHLYRRYRGDMIEVFKYLHGIYSVRSTELLPRAPKTALRGHDYKLMKDTVVHMLDCHSSPSV